MTHSTRHAHSNPFATRYVQPGAVPFLFPPALDAAALVARLGALGWRGAIVGPHGSGKSTLLEALSAELTRTGRGVVSVALHDGEFRLPPPLLDARPWSSETVVAIDGYEQLSAWSRWRLAGCCRRDGCGLLVTSHRPTRWSELFRTEINDELLEQIVAHLLTDASRLVSPEDVRQAFSVHGQNAREALFALYDLHEHRSRAGMSRL